MIAMPVLTLAALLGLAAPPEDVFIVNRVANSVTVHASATGAALPNSPLGPNPIAVGAAPASVLGVPSLKKVYVVSETTATVSIIDSEQMIVLRTVTLPNASLPGGMALAEDLSAIFIAARNTSLGEAGVYRLDLATETPSYVAGLASPAAAGDCEVIRAGAVGGSGSAPGKIYFTRAGSNEIGAIDLLGGPPTVTPLTPPVGLSGIKKMQRSPDHGFVLVAGTSPTSTEQRCYRIASATDAIDVVSVPTSGMSPAVQDVAFGPGLFPPFTCYWVGQDFSGNFIHQVTLDGTSPANSGGQSIVGAAFGGAIRYDATFNKLYVADTSGTSGQYQRFDASSTPPAPIDTPAAGSATDFAFMPAPPAPKIADVCPRGTPNASGTTVRVEGFNFLPNTRLELYDFSVPIAIPTTFVDANTLIGDVSLVAPTTYDVIVTNRDGSSATFQRYLSVFNAPGVNSLVDLPLPGAGSGYALRSVPHYTPLSRFKTLVEAQLGPYNPVSYRVFFWINGGYVEFDQLDAVDCDLSGRAFWIITRFGGTLTFDEPAVLSNSAGYNRVIRLTPGWNLVSSTMGGIGNFMTWTTVNETTDPSNLATAVSVGGSANVGTLYEYVNGQYQVATDLFVGYGYWIFNRTSGDLFLIFNPGAMGKPGPAASFAASGPVPPPPPGAPLGASSSSSGGCGLLGPEFLLLAALFRRRRAPRRLRA